MSRTTPIVFLCCLLTSVCFAEPLCVANKTCVPVTIQNQSGIDLYVLIHGSATKSYYDFTHNSYTKSFKPESNTITLKKASNTTLYLPGEGIMGGGRMIFAEERLTGVPDLATYPYLFDKIELGWTAKGTAVWNTTSVDFFGMPLQLSQGNTAVGFKDGTTRAEVIQALSHALHQESALYDEKFFYQPNGKILRVFSPQHFYTHLPNQWEPYISEGLDSLVTDDEAKGTGVYFNFQYGGIKFTNIHKLSNNSLSIDENGKTKVISGITTGNAVAGQIHPIGDSFAGMLSAALNRGVLANPKHWGQNGMPNLGYPAFYYQEAVGNYRYNTYAKVLIDFAIGNKLYATAYDDYWHMDSSISVGPANNAPVTIKILPLL